MKKFLVVTLMMGLSLTSCKKDATMNEEKITVDSTSVEIPVDMHNAMSSLDYQGTYLGSLPCADCEGIQTQLTLKQDKTYVLDEHYVKNGKALHPSKQTGRFQFDAKQPSLIRLEHATQPRVYFIGEGFAEARDIQTGEKLSEQLDYRLKQAR